MATTSTPARATTLDELHATLQLLVTDEGDAAGLSFVPGPSDPIISPCAKCGTTWLQQTWSETIDAQFGIPDYEALLTELVSG